MSTPARRLPYDGPLGLFRIGPDGLEAISDETLNQRLNEAELRQLRAAAPAYPELLEHPEVM